MVTWGKLPVGMAESFFPHPNEWRFEGCDTPLDRFDTRTLTAFFTSLNSVPPSCLKAWEERGISIPEDYGKRYNQRLLTPKDWASHFKNVLHRALVTRSITTQEPCRCCKFARENLQHFPSCDKAGRIFSSLSDIAVPGWVPASTTEVEKFALFAIKEGEPVGEGWVYLHLLLWRQFIGMLVGIEFDGASFNEAQVWHQAWKRFKSKCDAASVRKREMVRRAISRGEEPPDVSKHSCPAKPLAEWCQDGTLQWNDDLVQKIESLTSDSN